MSFLIGSIHHLDEKSLVIKQLRPLALAGTSGLFARHLPQLAKEDGTWTLSAEALMQMAEPNPGACDAIVFDLAPRSREPRTLYRLVEVSGRTASLVTDALFHFKVLKPLVAEGSAGADNLVFARCDEGPDRYEQLRLEGGASGGDWTWGESPTAVCATVL